MNEFGYSFEKQNTLFYFGTKNLTESLLKEQFPNFTFKKNKQVHSNIVIEAEQSPKEADGLWTTQKNTALIAVTADCVPILLSNGKKAFALHAGWRGPHGGPTDHGPTADQPGEGTGPHCGRYPPDRDQQAECRWLPDGHVHRGLGLGWLCPQG